jgi:hypothetical protein
MDTEHIKIGLKTGCEVVDWIHLAQNTNNWRRNVNSNES